LGTGTLQFRTVVRFPFRLIRATEKILNEWSQQILKRAEKGKPFTDAEIGIRVGKMINKYYMSKHFVTETETRKNKIQNKIKGQQYRTKRRRGTSGRKFSNVTESTCNHLQERVPD
jgi:hypothetical protein